MKEAAKDTTSHNAKPVNLRPCQEIVNQAQVTNAPETAEKEVDSKESATGEDKIVKEKEEEDVAEVAVDKEEEEAECQETEAAAEEENIPEAVNLVTPLEAPTEEPLEQQYDATTPEQIKTEEEITDELTMDQTVEEEFNDFKADEGDEEYEEDEEDVSDEDEDEDEDDEDDDLDELEIEEDEGVAVRKPAIKARDIAQISQLLDKLMNQRQKRREKEVTE